MSSNISVIMATYNGGNYLREQLDSILHQSLAPNEIIVGDDQSTDQTATILTEYAHLGLLKYHINNQRKGVIGNFKSAAENTTSGNYIAFADQDDVWLSEKLALSYNALREIEDPNLPCMVYNDPLIVDVNGNTIGDSLWDVLGFNNYKHTLKTVLFGNPAGGCTMLINPTLANYIPTIPDNCYMHDAWLTLVAYTFGKAHVMPHQVLKYRQHHDNVTFSTAYQPKRRLKRVFEELFAAFKGKSELFASQFIFVRQFYHFFKDDMNADQKALYEQFLALEDKGYFRKKFAFRRACK